MANNSIVSIRLPRRLALGALSAGTFVTFTTATNDGVILPGVVGAIGRVIGVVLTDFNPADQLSAGATTGEVVIATLGSGVVNVGTHDAIPVGSTIISTINGLAANSTRAVDAATPAGTYPIFGVALKTADAAGVLIPMIVAKNGQIVKV